MAGPHAVESIDKVTVSKAVNAGVFIREKSVLTGGTGSATIGVLADFARINAGPRALFGSFVLPVAVLSAEIATSASRHFIVVCSASAADETVRAFIAKVNAAFAGFIAVILVELHFAFSALRCRETSLAVACAGYFASSGCVILPNSISRAAPKTLITLRES